MHASVSKRPTTRFAATALVLGLVVAGCSRPVTVPTTDPSDDAAQAACRALDQALPSTVADEIARKVEPETPNTAAWGTPAITMRCGVTKPPGLQPTSQLLTISGVDWFGEQRTAGFVFTTVGRVANVEVAVPSNYQPESQVPADLTPAIKRAIPALSK